ncbi:hypothetical protein AB4304_13985 [Vibrio breoganii]
MAYKKPTPSVQVTSDPWAKARIAKEAMERKELQEFMEHQATNQQLVDFKHDINKVNGTRSPVSLADAGATEWKEKQSNLHPADLQARLMGEDLSL